ncbi:unnamed protein product, partial [Closterium sp. NIES-53]
LIQCCTSTTRLPLPCVRSTDWSTERSTSLSVTSWLESCSSVVSFVCVTWPLGPTLLIYSPRHFSLVIISASVLSWGLCPLFLTYC